MSRIVRRVHQAEVYFVTTQTWQRSELFRKDALAEIVVKQLLECRERGFYKLHQFVVMYDHLHILLTPGLDSSLERVMQTIKGGSSRKIGTELGSHWPVWQVGFHDRSVRDESEYRSFEKDIRENPPKRRLAERAELYPWSSANGKFLLDPSRFEQLQGLKPQENKQICCRG
jgi:putative transposase